MERAIRSHRHPPAGQNPQGTDNGGTGFGIWDFTGPKRVDGGFQNPVPPYGNLNHFIDGVDFPTTVYNDLGAPAFGLGNCNPGISLLRHRGSGAAICPTNASGRRV